MTDEYFDDGWTYLGAPEENISLVFEYYSGGVTSGYYYKREGSPLMHRRFYDYNLKKSFKTIEVWRWKYAE